MPEGVGSPTLRAFFCPAVAKGESHDSERTGEASTAGVCSTKRHPHTDKAAGHRSTCSAGERGKTLERSKKTRRRHPPQEVAAEPGSSKVRVGTVSARSVRSSG